MSAVSRDFAPAATQGETPRAESIFTVGYDARRQRDGIQITLGAACAPCEVEGAPAAGINSLP
jgi:hypothetical protein